MNIEELLGDKGGIIEKAMRNPGLAPKRNPTIEQAMKAVAAEVEFAAIQNVQQKVFPVIDDMYETYIMMNGDYSDTGPGKDMDPDEYASGLDDALEACLEPFEQWLSQNWMGTETIDARLWEKDAVVKLSQSVAKEVFKTLSYQKTPAQVLSSAGIVQADVEIYLEQHLTASPEKQKVATEATFESIVAKIKAQLGTDFDQIEVYNDLELMLDDDEILANGAGQRLGLNPTDVQGAAMLTLEHGDDTVDLLFEEIKKPDADKPKKERKATPPKDNAVVENPGSAVDAKVLALMKQHGSTKDTEQSAAMGVSRATYNNWINGKSPFTPNADQFGVLRTELVTNINGLLEALALLDGTEAMGVE